MNYYNERTQETFTEAALAAAGYAQAGNVDTEALRRAGIYPVRYDYPAVPDTYAMVPDKLTKEGDTYVRSFKLVDAPLDTAKTQLLERLADIRWQKETGGIELEGIKISTDRQSQAMITQTVAGLNLTNATDNPITTVKFKSDSGFVELSAEQIAAIGIAVTRHVEACYAREQELASKIESIKTIKTLRKLDLSAGWPV